MESYIVKHPVLHSVVQCSILASFCFTNMAADVNVDLEETRDFQDQDLMLSPLRGMR